MGRQTDIDNDNNDEQQQQQQQSTSTESRRNSNQILNENKFDINDDDDPLIHDTILPHRKRIRRDTLLSIQQQQQQQHYVQSQQSESSSIETSCKTEDVSYNFIIILIKTPEKEKKLHSKQVLTCANAIFLYKLYNNILIKADLERA